MAIPCHSCVCLFVAVAGSLADYFRGILSVSCEAIMPVFNDIILVPGAASNQTTDGMRGEVSCEPGILTVG